MSSNIKQRFSELKHQENLLNVRSQIGQESLTEMTKKTKSSGIYKNSSGLQQDNVKLWWSIS